MSQVTMDSGRDWVVAVYLRNVVNSSEAG